LAISIIHSVLFASLKSSHSESKFSNDLKPSEGGQKMKQTAKGLVDDAPPGARRHQIGRSGATEIDQARVLRDGEKVTKGLSALPGSDID
jgi:hypothetical protein